MFPITEIMVRVPVHTCAPAPMEVDEQNNNNEDDDEEVCMRRTSTYPWPPSPRKQNEDDEEQTLPRSTSLVES